MKLMNMNGGYSYEAYEKVLKELEQEKTHFLENIMAALTEYRANYKKGAVKAKIAHDNLNKFKDDDSGALMGDLLLNTLRTEDEAAWQADPAHHADMVTILMQGNSACVSEIMQNLAFAADTADDSFVTRTLEAFRTPDEDASAADIAAAENTGHSKTPFDLFFDRFLTARPGSTKDEAVTAMMQLYDDDAKMFASSLVGLNNYLTNYTHSELSMDAMQEEAEAYFEEHPFEDSSIWAGAANMYSLLSNADYGGTSLLNYLVFTENDYLSDTALLEGYQALNLPQRALLYPFVAEMSAGQRSLLEYTAMDRMLTIGLMDDETFRATYATMQDPEFGTDKLEVCSVYAEVNRNDFQVGEIAVTNAAQGKAASLGEEVNEGLFGVGISALTAGIGIGSIAVTVAGLAVAAKYTVIARNANALADQLTANVEQMARDKAKGAVYQWVEKGQSILKAGNANKFAAHYKICDDVNSMLAKIGEHDANVKFLIDAHKSGNLPFSRLQIKALASADSLKMTMPGSNQTILFDNGVIINYKEGTDQVVSLTTSKGNIYYLDGTTGVDETVKANYQLFASQFNADISKQISSIDAQLEQYATKYGYQNLDDYLSKTDELFQSLNEALGQKVIRNSDGVMISYFDDLFEAGSHYETMKLYGITERTSLAEGFDITTFGKKEQVKSFINFMKKKYPEQKELIAKLEKVENEKSLYALELRVQKKELEEIQKIKGDIHNQNPNDLDLEQQADEAMSAASGSTFWKWFGVGMAIVGLAMAAYSAYAAISEMQAYYHQEMLPIPRKMVDLGYYEDGTHCYIYYDCTKCNRNEMNMGNETLGEYGDLNGDVMKQWIALYTTKDTRAGSPIQAGFTVKKGTTNIPVRTVPLSFFGFDYAVNMTDTKFAYNNNANGIYLYYKQAANRYTGTVETGNTLVTTGVLSAIGGAGICGLIIALAGKCRKKEKPTGEPTAA